MKRRSFFMTAWLMCAFLMCVLLPWALMTSCSSEGAPKRVVIASKQYTENIILGEMYAQLIENLTDIEVERRQGMGNTAVCFTAMENGEIDMYVEYTGTVYNELLGKTFGAGMDPDALYEAVRQELRETKGVIAYQRLGVNNTYALAIPKGKADSLGIQTMSDLSPVSPRLVFAANNLYFLRLNDGYNTMVETYGFDFKSVVKMDIPLLYDAAMNDQVDVIIVYATDSRLSSNDMMLLEDDKHMFPDYFAVPVIRADTVEKYPELNHVLDLLAGRIDNEAMQALNYQVEFGGKTPGEAAIAFLTELGLITK